MTTSDQIAEIAAALAKAQASMKNATLNKVNPHFKSKYADLAGIRDAVIPALAAQSIAVVQTLDFDDSGGMVLTRLVHSSGQWVESACRVPPGKNMQEMGSAITYARRYSLSAICGIAADEDDDANAASDTKQPVTLPTAADADPPQRYREFLVNMTNKAESGMATLTAALNDAPRELRLHLTMRDNAKWEELKATAAKVRSKVPVSA